MEKVQALLAAVVQAVSLGTPFAVGARSVEVAAWLMQAAPVLAAGKVVVGRVVAGTAD